MTNMLVSKIPTLLFGLILIVGCENSIKKNKPVQLQNESSSKIIGKEILNEITDSIYSDYYPNIHSLLIYNSGKLIYEKYFEGEDEQWGNKLGSVKFDSNTLHDVRSISKSVVSACIGIAIKEGKIEGVHQSIFDFFEEYKDLENEQINRLTIYHLLTMSAGLEWDESVPIHNTEGELEESEDKVAFVLGRDMQHEPGKKFNYSGGNTELLANIILRSTGKNVYQYAQENIFDKINIENSAWTNYTGTSIPAAASGLRLTTSGLLNLGLLYLYDGKWENEQILPGSWVNESLMTSVLDEEYQEFKGGYGYQFWTWEQPFKGDSIHMADATGNGGQKIFIDKANQIVIVITAGNYNNWTLENDSYSIFEKIYEE
jgi:CubicO group peptidase (beta-lactamase class C family)